MEDIERMAASGELAKRISVPRQAQTMHLNAKDYPQLKDEKVGDPVVLISAGYVTGVPEETGNAREKGMIGPMMGLRVEIVETAVVHGKKPRLGSGERFKALAMKLKARGARDPEALASAIGRARYGKEKFQQLAAKGR